MFLFELVGGKKYYDVDVTVEMCKPKVSSGCTKTLLGGGGGTKGLQKVK